MGAVEKIINDPGQFLLALVVILLAIKEVHGMAMWWKDRAEGYHESRSKVEDFHKQVHDIAQTIRGHSEALGKINNVLDGLIERMESIEKRHFDDMRQEEEKMRRVMEEADRERKLDTIATTKAWIYRMYEELKDKDSLTMAEFETFNDLSKRYVAAGGNAIFKDKIIPEITSKRIEDPT